MPSDRSSEFLPAFGEQFAYVILGDPRLVRGFENLVFLGCLLCQEFQVKAMVRIHDGALLCQVPALHKPGATAPAERVVRAGCEPTAAPNMFQHFAAGAAIGETRRIGMGAAHDAAARMSATYSPQVSLIIFCNSLT